MKGRTVPLHRVQLVLVFYDNRIVLRIYAVISNIPLGMLNASYVLIIAF